MEPTSIPLPEYDGDGNSVLDIGAGTTQRLSVQHPTAQPLEKLTDAPLHILIVDDDL